MAKLPIADFLTARLKEYDPEFEVRKGTAFEQLFFKPTEFITNPLRDEADAMQIGQSFLRILLTDDPDAYSEEQVDALGSNLFVTRVSGSSAGGVARVFYDSAVDREYPVGGAVFTGNNGINYSNPAPFAITAAQMGAQIQDGLFYFDIPVVAEVSGTDTDLEANGLVTLIGDEDVISVTNQVSFVGGTTRETNRQYIERIKNSIGVRDLVTGKGFNGIIFENFASFVSELQPIGFGDPEMMRDIVYNTHIGGKVDGYVKTSVIRRGSKDFVGILTDSTRQSPTTANVQLTGTSFIEMGNPSIDRTGGVNPVVRQVKVSSAAEFTSLQSFASLIDLSVNQYVRIGIDGTFKDIRVAGVNPAQTSRNEVVNLINAAFGLNVAFPAGTTFKLRTPSEGLSSSLVIDNPSIGNSALNEVFGLSPGSAPYTYDGDGPITFLEGVHYNIDDANGSIQRIVGALILPSQSTGETTQDDTTFVDNTPNQFLAVQVNDILTIESGPDAGDYRIVEKTDNNTLVLDAELTTTASSVDYYVRRTGIKDGELVEVSYNYNPLSIDIGNLVKLDSTGRTRGIRPGREDMTITDMAFLRIVQIELIDPLTQVPLDQILNGLGGFGAGGFGEGAFGIGSGSDYYLKVNSPHERFSAFEDSYIVFNPGFSGLSVRVTYDYVPEIVTLHNFARSETERVLDGDILMKHFLPAYVDGEIHYRVDPTNSSVPTNEALTESVKAFITSKRAGEALEYSDIIAFIGRETDPFNRFGTFVTPFTLTGSIHNTNGSSTVVTGSDKLVVPTLDPFPLETDEPLSSRITHWIADNITLIRE